MSPLSELPSKTPGKKRPLQTWTSLHTKRRAEDDGQNVFICSCAQLSYLRLRKPLQNPRKGAGGRFLRHQLLTATVLFARMPAERGVKEDALQR